MNKKIIILGILALFVVVMVSGSVFGEEENVHCETGCTSYSAGTHLDTCTECRSDNGVTQEFCEGVCAQEEESSCTQWWWCNWAEGPEIWYCGCCCGDTPPACFTSGTKVIVFKDVDELTEDDEIVEFDDNGRKYNLFRDEGELIKVDVDDVKVMPWYRRLFGFVKGWLG